MQEVILRKSFNCGHKYASLIGASSPICKYYRMQQVNLHLFKAKCMNTLEAHKSKRIPDFSRLRPQLWYTTVIVRPFSSSLNQMMLQARLVVWLEKKNESKPRPNAKQELLFDIWRCLVDSNLQQSWILESSLKTGCIMNRASDMHTSGPNHSNMWIIIVPLPPQLT